MTRGLLMLVAATVTLACALAAPAGAQAPSLAIATSSARVAPGEQLDVIVTATNTVGVPVDLTLVIDVPPFATYVAGSSRGLSSADPQASGQELTYSHLALGPGQVAEQRLGLGVGADAASGTVTASGISSAGPLAPVSTPIEVVLPPQDPGDSGTGDDQPVPTAGVNALASPIGRVECRSGRDPFAVLGEAELIPLDSICRTGRRGRLRLTTVRNVAGTLQTGVFRGWIAIGQSAPNTDGDLFTLLRLEAPLKCGLAASLPPLYGPRRARPVRWFWGRATGNYRTLGGYSVTTVRGTTWRVVDRCRSTTTIVDRGRVQVRDRARRRTVTLRRGERYTARARR